MKRDAFFEQLNHVLDQRKNPDHDDALQAAAADNADYEQLLIAQKQLLQHVSDRRPTSPDLSERILAEISSGPELAAKSNDRSKVWVGALLMAAAALVAVFAWNSIPAENGNVELVEESQTQPREEPEQLTAPQIVENPVRETAPEKPLPELMQEMQQRYYALAEETGNTFSEVALLLPSTPSDPMDVSGNWIPDVGRQISPLTSPVGSAFDFLLDALPSDDQG